MIQENKEHRRCDSKDKEHTRCDSKIKNTQGVIQKDKEHTRCGSIKGIAATLNPYPSKNTQGVIQ